MGASLMPKDQIVFPYTDFVEASKDKFEKVGGKDGAFRLMVKGFKAEQWRKRTDASAKERDAAHDAALQGKPDAVSSQGAVEFKTTKTTFPKKGE
jgi:hypothetical protein